MSVGVFLKLLREHRVELLAKAQERIGCLVTQRVFRGTQAGEKVVVGYGAVHPPMLPRTAGAGQ